MEVVVTTVAISPKLQTNHHQQQTNIQFFHRPNVLPVAQPTNATLDIKSNNLCDTICLLPLQVDNIFLFIEQVAPVPACWLFKTSATSWPLTFWLESVVRVTCDVGYVCANFSLPRPHCSQVWPDVCDRQTDRRQIDVRQKHRLMPLPCGERHNNTVRWSFKTERDSSMCVLKVSSK